MRFILVKFMKSRPHRYNKFATPSAFNTYLNQMAEKGTPGNLIVLQAAADFFYHEIAIFTVKSVYKPWKVIRP